MAFITRCEVCNKDTCHSNNECLDCKVRNNRNAKEMELKARSKLSIEERLTLIESDLWDAKSRINYLDDHMPKRFA